MRMNRFALAMAAAAVASLGATGCATKKYVRTQDAPIIEHQGQQDKQIAENDRVIHDVDERAQSGVHRAMTAAEEAAQAAQAAGQQAQAAQQTADGAVHRVDSLEAAVKGLDSYKVIAEVTVNFAPDKFTLSKESQSELDAFAAKIGESGYILEVTGGTDARGGAEYNYQLSQHRASSVVTYLAAKHHVPAHRFYLIGIGKDQAVAPNNTAAGRKQNRRVTIQLLSNQGTTMAGK